MMNPLIQSGRVLRSILFLSLTTVFSQRKNQGATGGNPSLRPRDGEEPKPVTGSVSDISISRSNPSGGYRLKMDRDNLKGHSSNGGESNGGESKSALTATRIGRFVPVVWHSVLRPASRATTLRSTKLDFSGFEAPGGHPIRVHSPMNFRIVFTTFSDDNQIEPVRRPNFPFDDRCRAGW